MTDTPDQKNTDAEPTELENNDAASYEKPNVDDQHEELYSSEPENIEEFSEDEDFMDYSNEPFSSTDVPPDDFSTMPEMPEMPEMSDEPSPDAVVSGAEADHAVRTSPGTEQSNHDTQSVVFGFRTIGAPLLAAVTEVRPFLEGDGAKNIADNAKSFAELLQNNVALGRKLGEKLGAQNDNMDDWMRWSLAGGASKIISAHYRATGKMIESEELDEIAATLSNLAEQDLGAVPDQEPEEITISQLRLKLMFAMAPVIGAVSRYAFGRAEQALVGEVAARLQRTAKEAAEALVPQDASEQEWRKIYGNVLEVSGHLYSESHYAEADRLLDMRPDERTAYLTKYGNEVPMGPVWESFDLNMAMLTAIASYLEVPGHASWAEPEE